MRHKEFVVGKVEFATVTSGHEPSVAMPSGGLGMLQKDWKAEAQQWRAKAEAAESVLSATMALAQKFITAAERYRIHSELLFNGPIEITVAMLEARNALLDSIQITS